MAETVTNKTRLGPIGAIMLVIAGLVAGVFLSGPLHGLVHRHDQSAATTQPGSTPTKQEWTCGMHPQVVRDEPGLCPICQMELVPIVENRGTSGAGGSLNVTINPAVVQNMGIRTAEVKEGAVRQVVRALGYLVEPENQRRDINLRVSGWIEKLYANTEGMSINKGDVLFDFYSPEMQVAIGDLISARKAGPAAGPLFASARRKLELWGLSQEQVDDLAKLDQPPETVPVRAPISGHLVERNVYEGAAVEMGQRALRLADRSEMWLDTQVFERQLSLVDVDQVALATVLAFPGKQFEGKVSFIHPHIDPQTRTALVRIVLDNKDHLLKQGMYATVDLRSEPTPPTPLAPREAVIDTGTRQVVFVAKGDGRFEPREVKMGLTGADEQVQVLRGLSAGERVVTSGQFLLDSESRLREAVHKLANPDGTSSPATQTANTSELITVAHVDDITAAYLRLSEYLGTPQQTDDPVDVSTLLVAARQSLDHTHGDGEPLVRSVVTAVEAMRGQDLNRQRELFVMLSDAMIKLLDRAPPSNAVADEVYVVHCPMAFSDQGAHWLQTSRDIANPFYTKTMKNCGEIVRTVARK